VQPLLDAVVQLLPSPPDLPDVAGLSADDKEKPLTRKRTPEDPWSAIAFKIMSDPYVGHLTYIRVYSGTMKTGTAVLNTRTGKRERIAKMLQMQANNRTELPNVQAGDIIALAGMKNVATGDTLCDQKHPIRYESVDFPEPVIAIAIEPKSQQDSDKLTKSLDRIMNEDPTFRVSQDPETLQTLIRGMGELHLEIIVDRLKREFRVAANVGKPQVAYREAVTETVRAEEKFVREGGLNQYGHVKIEISPAKDLAGLVFENKAADAEVPKRFVDSVAKGLEETMQAGPISGFPVIGLKAVLLGGSFSEDVSDEIAFKIAAGIALRKALRDSKPILLEPVMAIEVLVPEEYVSNVVTDLNSRRSQIRNVGMRGYLQVVEAIAPLSEMFGYSTQLRSISQGRATYTMQFASFQQVSKATMEQITGGFSG